MYVVVRHNGLVYGPMMNKKYANKAAKQLSVGDEAPAQVQAITGWVTDRSDEREVEYVNNSLRVMGGQV